MTTQSNPTGPAAVQPAARRHEAHGRPFQSVRPHPLTVEDVMSSDVVTVGPTATFHEMTGLLRRHGISALPVVDEQGALLGIVSEADLLFKEIPPPTQCHGVIARRRSTTRRPKAGSVAAADVMTAPAISVGSQVSLAAAVRLLQYHHIKRLAVLDADNHLVGIISRRDLLAGFSRSDAEIRADVVEGVIPRWLPVDPAGIRVEVNGGVVRLEGVVAQRSAVEVLAHLVRGIDGVVDVDNAVEYIWDGRQERSDMTSPSHTRVADLPLSLPR